MICIQCGKEIHGHILMIGLKAFCSQHCIRNYNSYCGDCMLFPGRDKRCMHDTKKRKIVKLNHKACNNFRGE